MPRLAANLSFLYPELPFMARFEAAARDGFEGVEFLFPHEHPVPELKARLAAHGLQQVLFNAPPGDWAAGERGLACRPGREREFQDAMHVALRTAEQLQCPRVHVMSGLVPEGSDPHALRSTWVANLRWAAKLAASQGTVLTVEPINPQDMPGYWLTHQAQAHELCAEVGEANLQVQMDLYHCQMVEGEVTPQLEQYLHPGRVAHLQIAGVPGRHEPDVGVFDLGALLGLIDQLSAERGWSGWLACEYRPQAGAVPGGTSAGLKRWRASCQR
jgi:hydroxypyruvate isomerase